MRTLFPESGLQTAPNLQKSEEWQWRHNFLTWPQRQIFLSYSLSLVKFSYWSKYHFNIITGSGIMTIFFYKGFTRNPEIENTPVWVLPNTWRLEQVMDTKFGTNVSNRMLLNAAKCHGYSFNRFWVIKGKLTGGGGKITPKPPLRLGLKSLKIYITGR